MAIYEFACTRCGNEFELMRPMSQSNAPAKCPKCKAVAQKQISCFGAKAGFYLKGPEGPAFRSAGATSKKTRTARKVTTRATKTTARKAAARARSRQR